MGSSSDETSDLSESDIEKYKKLLSGEYKVKGPRESLRRLFCADRKKQDYKYKDLLQHATGAGKRSAKGSAQQKGNELEPLPQRESEPVEQTELYCWPWTGIIVNIKKDFIDDVGNRSYLLKKLSKYKPLDVQIYWDSKKQMGQAVVKFESNWSGFKNAMEFEKSFEASSSSKKEWNIRKDSPGSSFYGWFAREDDYKSEGKIGVYLRKIGELKTISDLIKEATQDRTKVVASLASKIDLRNENLDELQTKYNANTLYLSRMLEEKDVLHQALFEGSVNRSAQQKANHLALAKLLITDLASEAGLLLQCAIDDATAPDSKVEQTELYYWPWTGIIFNIKKQVIDENDVDNRSYLLKKLSKYKPIYVNIFWDLEKKTGQAVVKFDSDWDGFKNAMEFEKSFEASNGSKKVWSTCKDSPGSSLYGWIAREDDYKSKGQIGVYLRGNGKLKTISDLVKEATQDRDNVVAHLASEINLKNENLDELQTRYTVDTMKLSRMLKEKDLLHQSFFEETRRMQRIARDEQEKLNNELENKKQELESWSRQLNKREALIERERQKLEEDKKKSDAWNSSLQMAFGEQRKVDENVLRLVEEQKVVISKPTSYTTLVAVRFVNGVILGADRLLTNSISGRSIIVCHDATKIDQISDRIYLSMSGNMDEVASLLRVTRGKLLTRFGPFHNNQLDIREFVQILGETRTSENKLNTFFLVGGLDLQNNPRIFQVPPSPSPLNSNEIYLCGGSGASHVSSFLTYNCRDNMSRDDAWKTVEIAVEIGIHSDIASGGQVQTVQIMNGIPSLDMRTVTTQIQPPDLIGFELSMDSISRLALSIETLMTSGILGIVLRTTNEKGEVYVLQDMGLRGVFPMDCANLIHFYAEQNKRLISISAYDDETVARYNEVSNRAESTKLSAYEQASSNYNQPWNTTILEAAKARADEEYHIAIANAISTKEVERRGYWYYDIVQYFDEARKARQQIQLERMRLIQ